MLLLNKWRRELGRNRKRKNLKRKRKFHLIKSLLVNNFLDMLLRRQRRKKRKRKRKLKSRLLLRRQREGPKKTTKGGADIGSGKDTTTLRINLLGKKLQTDFST